MALLCIIYVAFISLGLPDSVLGAAWPVMHIDLGVDISYAGLLSMTCCFGTIISSLCFSIISKHFKTPTITAFSTMLTAIALFLYGVVDKFYLLIPVALLLGLGAGSIDSALNNYVSLNYKASHMGFLHAAWGIGTTIGPFILTYAFSNNLSWHFGYLTIATIQAMICILLFASKPLWKKKEGSVEIPEEEKSSITYKEALKRKGAAFALLGFFAYCSMENSAILWSAAFAVDRGMSEAAAASCSGLLFWGITIGRLLTGFTSERLGDKLLIRSGIVMILIGIVMIITIPLRFLPLALFFLGFGYAPLYPSMIHQTSILYGRKYSATLIGLQMASAYVGSTFMPSIFGLISKRLGISILPYFILILTAITFIATELKRGKKQAPGY